MAPSRISMHNLRHCSTRLHADAEIGRQWTLLTSLQIYSKEGIEPVLQALHTHPGSVELQKVSASQWHRLWWGATGCGDCARLKADTHAHTKK